MLNHKAREKAPKMLSDQRRTRLTIWSLCEKLGSPASFGWFSQHQRLKGWCHRKGPKRDRFEHFSLRQEARRSCQADFKRRNTTEIASSAGPVRPPFCHVPIQHRMATKQSKLHRRPPSSAGRRSILDDHHAAPAQDKSDCRAIAPERQ